MDFEKFLSGEAHYLSQIWNIPPFSTLIPLLDQLYNLSINLLTPDTNPFFGRRILLCHKCFLSAASLIARGLPEDSGPITRRAVEIAIWALTGKVDQRRLIRWGSYEERLSRWKDRQEGRKPKPLKVPLLSLHHEHPLHRILEELKSYVGIYSDSDAHFTPEYLITRDWKIREGEIFLNYFTQDPIVIERSAMVLSAAHHTILLAFNACLDGALAENEDWIRHEAEFIAKGHEYSKQFETPEGKEGT